jgi:hypothetical protein
VEEILLAINISTVRYNKSGDEGGIFSAVLISTMVCEVH